MKQRVLVTGGSGQVGRALLAAAPPGVEIAAPGRGELDLERPERLAEAVRRVAPDLIVNTAAYTAVDRAETEADRARRVNAAAVRCLAESGREVGARLIQLSTNYVFDGTRGRPYLPSDPTSPLSVYGATKLEGERAVAELLGDGGLVLRTAWVHAATGHNFVAAMLRAMTERERVRVVADQIGAPTWAGSVAAAVWAAAGRPGISGVIHWTDAGVASWYDFAVAVQEEALALGLLDRPVPVDPISTDEYPMPARRPLYGVLDCTGARAALELPAEHWRVNLRRMLREVAGG